MAYICQYEGRKCKDCEHCRWDSDKQRHVCYAQIDEEQKEYSCLSKMYPKMKECCDYTECDIIQITTNEVGERNVHILGYTFYLGEPEEKPYRLYEYTGFHLPLIELKRRLVTPYRLFILNDEEIDRQNIYIQELTEYEVSDIVMTYDNGKAPQHITFKDLFGDIKDGMYILY